MDESTLIVIMGMGFMFFSMLCCCSSAKARSEENKKQPDAEAPKPDTKQAQGVHAACTMYYQDLGWQQFHVPPAPRPVSPTPDRVTMPSEPDRTDPDAPPPPPSCPTGSDSDETEPPTYKEALQAEDTVVSVHMPDQNRTTTDV